MTCFILVSVGFPETPESSGAASSAKPNGLALRPPRGRVGRGRQRSPPAAAHVVPVDGRTSRLHCDATRQVQDHTD